MNKTISLTDKGKHLIKAVDQPIIKLVKMLKGKTRNIMCNYNSKLSNTHKYIQQRSKKQ